MTLSPNERIKQIRDFVLARRTRTEEAGHTNPDFDYRWKHTLRVAQYGKRIAEAEGADVEIVMAACLLHDISKFDAEKYGVDHGRVSARIARPFLETLGYTPEQVNNICFSIAAHVDDKADFEHPITVEAKAVNDADNVDRFGAYRLLLQFKDNADKYEALIEQATRRIETLKKYRSEDVLSTPTGNKLFNRQLDLQINFLERMIEDSKMTIEPEI